MPLFCQRKRDYHLQFTSINSLYLHSGHLFQTQSFSSLVSADICKFQVNHRSLQLKIFCCFSVAQCNLNSSAPVCLVLPVCFSIVFAFTSAMSWPSWCSWTNHSPKLHRHARFPALISAFPSTWNTLLLPVFPENLSPVTIRLLLRTWLSFCTFLGPSTVSGTETV